MARCVGSARHAAHSCRAATTRRRLCPPEVRSWRFEAGSPRFDYGTSETDARGNAVRRGRAPRSAAAVSWRFRSITPGPRDQAAKCKARCPRVATRALARTGRSLSPGLLDLVGLVVQILGR